MQRLPALSAHPTCEAPVYMSPAGVPLQHTFEITPRFTQVLGEWLVTRRVQQPRGQVDVSELEDPLVHDRVGHVQAVLTPVASDSR